MRRQYIVIEHRIPELVKKLREELKDSRALIEKLKHDYRDLETRYGYEIYLNSELVDLLNAHSIPYREALDYKKRYRAKPGDPPG